MNTLVNQDGLTKAQAESNPAAPPPIRVNLDGIHPAFRPYRQWVNWHWEWREKEGKWAKVPIRICRTGKTSFGWVKASPTGPKSWVSFEEAAWLPAVCERNGDYRIGIGFALTASDPFFAVDLDKCRSPITGGCVLPFAQSVIDRYNTLTEVSTSEFGYKLYGIGKKPGEESRTPEIEVYDRARYVAMTGFNFGPHDLIDCQSTLSAHYFELFPDDTPTKRAERKHDAEAAAAHRAANPNMSLSDREIIDKMFAAKNGARARALWSNDWSAYPSRSEADSALASMLAFYAGPDAARVESLMLQSGLVRDKWFQAREGSTYLRVTIAHVLSGSRSYFGDGRFPKENYDLSPEAEEMLFGRRNTPLSQSSPYEARVRVPTAKAAAPFPETSRQFRENTNSNAPAPAPDLGDYLKPPTIAEMQAEVAEEEALRLAARRYRFSSDSLDSIINADDGLGKLPLCPSYYQHAMYSPEKSSIGICRHGCHRWTCKVCHIALRRLYAPHFARLLLTESSADNPLLREKRRTPIYLSIIEQPDTRAIEALASRVNRLGGQYIVIVREYKAETATALTTVPVRGSRPITPEEAAAINREDIYAIDPSTWGLANCRPVYRSAAWALPVKEPSDNIELGPVRKADPLKVIDAIRDEGFDPQTFRMPARGIDLGFSFKIKQTDEAKNDPVLGKYKMIDVAARIVGRIEIRIEGVDPDAVDACDFLWNKKAFPRRDSVRPSLAPDSIQNADPSFVGSGSDAQRIYEQGSSRKLE